LAVEPDVLVCDEPVSALDQVTQAAILDLLGRLRSRGLALLLISHDLTVVRTLCSRIIVLRDGRIVESGPTEEIWNRPENPYTRSLLEHTDGLRRDKENSLT
jgi:peptide/nickel transport system ATP-binding protein